MLPLTAPPPTRAASALLTLLLLTACDPAPAEPPPVQGSAGAATLSSYPSGSIDGTVLGGQLGWSVAGVGDMNGDGYGDVAAGAPSAGGGSVRLWYGGASGIDGSADWSWVFAQSGEQAGYQVIFAGDVNGDGLGDMAWSVRGETTSNANAGAIYVRHGVIGTLPTTYSTRVTGTAPFTFLGTELASAGDVNGDGYSDLIVGLPNLNNGTGQARAYLGSASGMSSTAAWTVEGTQVGSAFGSAVASACDANGDGFGDVIVGSSMWDNVQTDEGRASIFYGSALGLSTVAGWNVESNQNNAHMGAGLACAGDVNVDGRGDIAVGTPEWDASASNNEGRVTVYMSGPSNVSTTAGWTFLGTGPNAETGASIAVADPNGDGRPDLFVGAPGSSSGGGLHVFWGLATGTFDTSDLSLLPSAATRSGTSVAAAGDVNGDGVSDLVTGRPLYDPSALADAGRMSVWEGGGTVPRATADLTLTTTGATYGPGYYGAQVAGRGDINGDGYGDLVVQEGITNSPCCNDHLGTTRLYLGSASGLGSSAAWTRLGILVSEGDQTVVLGGDTNGDGYDELVFGWAGYSNGQTYEGRIAGFFGSPTGLGTALSFAFESDLNGGNWGASIQPAGDVDGDGYGDLVTVKMTNPGALWLVHGSASGPIAPSAASPEFSFAVGQLTEGLGANCDVNGDSLPDLAMGTPTWTNGNTEEGRIQIFTGDGIDWSSTSWWVKEGNTDSRHDGRRLAFVGDVNADGYCDWAGGSWDAPATNKGRVEILEGDNSAPFPTAAETWTGATSQQLSYNGVGTAGDLNGDGYGDVLVGSAVINNGTQAYTGSVLGLDTSPDWEVAADTTHAPSGVGDLNGDGFDDVAIGLQASNIVRVFYGGGLNGQGRPLGSRFQLRRANSTVPIRPSNQLATLAFDVHGAGLRSYLGRARVGMQWQREYASAPWTTDHEVISPFTDSGLTGASLTSASSTLTDPMDALGWETAYQVRVRPRLSPVHGHPDLWGRYLNPGPTGQPRAAHLRTGALPDADGDGDPDPSDCADNNPSIYTGAAEVPDNNVDDNCDGILLVTCWPDGDGDGWGSGSSSLLSSVVCVAPLLATQDGDCLDADPVSHPGATDLVGDGIDQDCSGADTVLCFGDIDQDGWGAGSASADADGLCSTSFSQAALGGDCEDGDATIYPGAPEVLDDAVDDDCSGFPSVSCFADQDGDHWGGASTVDVDGSCTDDPGQWLIGGDCLDVDPWSHPGATELVADGIDQDCSGFDSVWCWADADGDGFGGGSGAADPDGSCAATASQSGTGGDCDDALPSVHPGAAELADNGTDEDCSGADLVSCFADDDGDGFGAEVETDPDGSCTDDGGQVATPGDCDDLLAGTFPGAAEVADDGIDQDCTGTDLLTCFVDGDGDGFGGPGEQLDPDGDCGDDGGQSALGGDCADAEPGFYPGASDPTGDGLDQDCSGSDSASCWTDGDGDGAGALPIVVDNDGSCEDPGQSSTGGDCDDLSAQRTPGTPEVADDGIDQDCSGTDLVTCWADLDGDGWGTAFTVASPDGSCLDDPGEAPLTGDCDDSAPSIHPGAPDLGTDSVDQDCSGGDTASCFLDADGDGVGGPTVQTDADSDCADDPAQSWTSGDCDDLDPARAPGLPELAGDGVDQDCNFADAAWCFLDTDGDGIGGIVTAVEVDGDCDDDSTDSSLSTDCDDNDPARAPGLPEIAFDGLDQDCDGLDLLDCLSDQDGDGAAGTAPLVSFDQDCDDPGEFWTSTDCDDNSPFIRPGLPDAPGNGVDEDCSGSDSRWCYEDLDDDGFGNIVLLSVDLDCDDPLEGPDFLDCDDNNPFVGQGGAELCNGIDDDCDPGTDEAWDIDGDGLSLCEGDCDDDDPNRGPFAAESCNGVDDDCDPSTDEEDDADNDGLSLCEGDCAPTDPTTSPLASELCDGFDQDCDGVSGPGENDLDGDEARPCGGDCDDLDAAVGPAVAELCDGIDTDCDGAPGDAEVDTDQDGVTECEGDCGPFDPLVSNLQSERCDSFDTNCDGVLAAEEGDADGDGWMPCTGDCDDNDDAARPYAPELAVGPDTNCDGLIGDADDDGDGSTVSGGDCDDGDPTVHPGATEICSGADEDCDGVFLAGERQDRDGDGSVDCLDCNALDPSVHPGATELCDGIDGDCDGYGLPPGESDLDNDGAIPCRDDCDDQNPLVREGLPEDCGDGLDNDCDGSIDLNTDADQDGVGACDGDCQDTDSDVFPFALETCDGQDEDCDGVIDDGWDEDGDGFTRCEGDCEDGDASVWPGAPAVCDDGLDNDCFPGTHESVDFDGDGYIACGDPGDCWEGNVRVSPLGLEVCNGMDDNCDGDIDEGIDLDEDGFSPCTFDCLEGDPTTNPRAVELCGDGLDQDCDGVVDDGCVQGDDDSAAGDDDSATTPETPACGACSTAGGPGWWGVLGVLWLRRRGRMPRRKA